MSKKSSVPDAMTTKSNRQRKLDQKQAYHAMFHPKRKPRSRNWARGSRGAGK